jgi:4a-hydroxytetrahydrobiopterin dehydratase
MNRLTEMQCVPCRGGEPPVTAEDRHGLLAQVPDWRIIQVDSVDRLQRVYKFKDFARALAFTNRVGELAEQNDHHPAILTEWGRVTVSWWTHAIKGLHRNDFIMAAKTDAEYERDQ